MVAVLALEGVVAFDLATPLEVFARIRLADGSPGYDVRVCGPGTEIDAGSFVLRPRHGLDILGVADTIIVPGIVDVAVPVPEEVLSELRTAAARGARIASICAGAFVLAASGLLDGRRATTHWLAATRLAETFPEVEVDPGVLYVDNAWPLSRSSGITDSRAAPAATAEPWSRRIMCTAEVRGPD